MFCAGDAAVVVGYGHLGDGNVHLNVSAPKYDDQVLKQLPCFGFNISWFKSCTT